LIDAESLTVNQGGGFYFFGGAGHFMATNAPRMISLTNSGLLSVGSTMILGADRTRPFSNIVNFGEVEAAGIRMRTAYFQNSGEFDIDNSFRVEAQVGKLEKGRVRAGVELWLEGNDLKMHQYTNDGLRSVILRATNSLADSGPGAGNLVRAGAGFHLPIKPRFGDLLGTRFVSSAAPGAAVDHSWGAADRGADVSGYSNNVAVGQLTVGGGIGSRLQFRGASPTGANGLYVDFLELQGESLAAFRNHRLDQVLGIAPNLTIYFAFANVPAEELSGQLGGRIQWVRDFVGPNSSIEIALPSGKTIRVNRALRESVVIDSDGDGLANGYDLTPFGDVVVEAVVTSEAPSRTVVRWTAAPLTTYHVEYATDVNGEWQTLATVTNSESNTRTVQVEDVPGAEGAARYYRVRYNP
jgi:hypothetical protein